MPSQFDKLGIRFSYPDDWTLDEQNVEGGQTVAVASPGGAFWWLSIHSAQINVAEVARAVMEGLKLEYDNLDVEPVVDVFSAQEMVGYDINFYCLDLVNTAKIRGFQTTEATYTMLWQAEDREFDQVLPVFEAITTSLIQSTQGE